MSYNCMGCTTLDKILAFLYKAIAFATSLIVVKVVVTGWSMHPTLISGEYVLCNRFSYVWRAPKRGDVVIARIGPDNTRIEIKRIVAIPGDIVCVKPGVVKVNNVHPVGPTYPTEIDNYKTSAWNLKEDEWFLLGDNMAMLDMSIDSRLYGPISRKSIKAKAILVCWPLSSWRTLGIK